MSKKILIIFLLLATNLDAATNPPHGKNGISREVCDIRVSSDNLESPEPGSLRDRLEWFNMGHMCLYGIYFLTPMTITLNAPLYINDIQSPLLQNVGMAGTYISGLDQNSNPLPVIIDGSQLTLNDDECVIMIEGGLKSFQQIHDITIRVPGKRKKAICDENGNSLLRKKIPSKTARACTAGTIALHCDYKNISVEVMPQLRKFIIPENIKNQIPYIEYDITDDQETEPTENQDEDLDETITDTPSEDEIDPTISEQSDEPIFNSDITSTEITDHHITPNQSESIRATGAGCSLQQTEAGPLFFIWTLGFFILLFRRAKCQA